MLEVFVSTFQTWFSTAAAAKGVWFEYCLVSNGCLFIVKILCWEMGSIVTTVHRLTLSLRCRVNQYSGTRPLGKCRYVENQYSCVISSHFNQGGWDMTPWQLSQEWRCTMAWISMGSGETRGDANSSTYPTYSDLWASWAVLHSSVFFSLKFWFSKLIFWHFQIQNQPKWCVN